ncbi:atlastin-2-like [Spodoptera litura]|uniref:Atlastin-2-like n=1 Tax=Spodoptera litura TaxID=69820 RepID=A0A9J7E236_SPOLT|nr:atlastin-2-like [Spodoptera litura]XP_022821573.1 atlastin-2-like [Spodoptera litura]
MSGGTQKGGMREGVQVVKLGEGAQRYELDEEALRRVLLRQDVRGLPVVVVSVAGAYRGGKSFILDFFLRYLKASRYSQQNGAWLGNEDEPLQGFHWRGGSERNTTGIHLWSEPIITTLEATGEKVAVLLMDTQGTFDSETTIGQNSTIFALSTLISSVQIYNLTGNIKEDDLQHLQLFTEYGRLACDSKSKAFQTLLFLVRDWPHAFEHAYGFLGGSTLLNKRLQAKVNQNPELRQVREHIRTCFDNIKCFLMPHPGHSVEDLKFTGCLRDLREQFRLALLELVPSLFDPKHLTPKLISGERVTTQDLFDYFKTYVGIFNSDEVPEAVTIFKATADACLLAATREARELYSQQMEARVRDNVSVSNATLTAWHDEARDQALRRFVGKKKLASQADVDTHLEALKKELGARLSQYLWNNDIKVRDTMTFATEAYEAAVSSVSAEHARLCLHPQDLDDLHARALQQALEVFDAAREVLEGEEDDRKLELICRLEQRFEHLCVINEQNNKNSVMEAREAYVRRMKLEMDQSGVSSGRLSTHHRDAVDSATTSFYAKRNLSTRREDDPHVARLLQDTNEYFVEFEKANINRNKMALHAAENVYNNYMVAEWGPQMCCFHPKALEDLHNKGKQMALEQFLSNRVDSEDDEYKAALMKNLGIRLTDLKEVNEFNNKQAAEQALRLYTTLMDKYSRPSAVSILVIPFIIKLFGSLPARHEESKDDAIREFMKWRRGANYGNDVHFDRLVEKIEEVFQTIRHPFLAILRETGIYRT